MKHDAQGFLLGERINAPTSNASPAIAVLGAVRRDVSVIRRILESRVGRPGVQSTSGRRQDAAVSRAASAAVSATVRRAVSESVARASTSRGQAVTPMLRDARGRFARVAGVRTPGATPSAGSVAVAVPSGAVRPAGRLAAADGRSVADSDRDARGRFAGGGGGGGSDYAGESVIGKIASSLDGIKDSVDQAGNIDPTISALKEVRDVVSPLGRAFGVVSAKLVERRQERHKERWYKKLIKAMTDRAMQPVFGGDRVAGGGVITRAFMFLPRMMGRLLSRAFSPIRALLGRALGGAGRLARSVGGGIGRLAMGAGGRALGFLGGILSRVFLPVAAAWGAWELGQWIGGKIYEWLDKSGILTKAFDAFDSMVDWFKEKFKAAGDAAKNVVNAASKAAADAQLGSDEARYGPLDAETRREARLGTRGAPPESTAYKAGRAAGTIMRGADAAVGGIKRLIETGAGYNVVERADGSVVKQQGARNWRNNNPGNIEFGPFARKMGAIGSDGRFAVFPEHETGRRAKAALIFEGKNYRDLNLTDAISRYAPPTENDTGAYQRAVLSSVGGANRKMSDYSPVQRDSILDAMQRVEGFKVGTTTGIRAASVPAVASTSIPAIKPATVPMTAPDKPAVVQAPPVPERLGSARQTPVVISKDDVNQDVRDRRLAHIVTGGIGG